MKERKRVTVELEIPDLRAVMGCGQQTDTLSKKLSLVIGQGLLGLGFVWDGSVRTWHPPVED